MSREIHHYPTLLKPVDGWQLRVHPQVVIDALEAKLSDLEDRLANSSSVGNYQQYLIDTGPADNATILAARMHEARFSRFNVSQLKHDINICKSKIGSLRNQKAHQLNRAEMEWIGEYLNLPSILRRVADEIEEYYKNE